MTQPRQPKGVPTGGQFAATQHDECSQDLGGLVEQIDTEVLPNGNTITWRYSGGRLNDGPNGEPARVARNADGMLLSEHHYREGQLDDPDDGSPAVKNYSAVHERLSEMAHYREGLLNDPPSGGPARLHFLDGALHATGRYTEGELNDGPNGEPAEVLYRSGGVIESESRYKQGKLCDGPNGEPAFVAYTMSGTIDYVEHYDMDRPIDPHDDEAGVSSV